MTSERDAAPEDTLGAEAGDAPTLAADVSIPPAARSRIGGRYEIEALLGAGGMGSVYRARDVELDELVALKVLRRALVDQPGMLDRFRREAKLARRVTHQNVARVFDIGEHEGEKFLTMEYVDGESLAARIARRGALPISEAIEIASAMCAGVASAHAAGVIHRDLKPDNVMIGKDGRVVVTDFGIARALNNATGAAHTATAMIGTPAYMAPEQVTSGEEIDERTDVYALGATLFEMFTGARAWPGESPLGVAAARLVDDAPDPREKKRDLPPAIAELVLRCMKRNKEERFASAGEIAAAFATITLPAPAAAASIAPPMPRASVAPPARSMAPAGPRSVAVLPFKNVGPADDDYLASELTDDLVDALSMTSGLRVTSRGMVESVLEKSSDPRAIGAELGVEVVAEGSVRRTDGRVRISARLVSVTDGFQVWAKRFDRPEQDVLRINDETAREIAGALRIAGADQARDAPDDPITIDLYLRGRQEYRRFGPDAYQRAIDLFTQALARAPNDPTILAAHAIAEARLAFYFGARLDGAHAAAERALAAGPALAEPRLALSSVLLQKGDTAGAVREVRRAIARGPGLAEAHASLGRILAEAGHVEEGIRRMETAIAIDPAVPLAHGQLARTYGLLGKWENVGALHELVRRTEGRAGMFVYELRTLLWRREKERARELAESIRPGENEPATAMLRLFLSAARDTSLDEKNYAGMNELALAHGKNLRRRTFIRQVQAEVAGYFGRNDRVIEALRSAIDDELFDLLWLDRCALLDGVRDHADYASLRARVKARSDEVLAAYRA